MTAIVVRADSRRLPLADSTVDLVVTSPPYFGLRSYQDGGEHYTGQVGDEATPAEFIAALLEVTAECVRVLKPTGSIWVNLGDAYNGKPPGPQGESGQRATRSSANEHAKARGRERRPAPRMTREDAAWLAGVIDSDGSVSVHVNKQPEGRAPSFVPWMRVGQMRPDVVARIAEVTGVGSVVQDGRGVYNWAASAQQARWVLERIHPWLLIKKRQAWAAIEVARHVEERNSRGSYRPLTSADVAYRQRLRDAVLLWNQGLPDDLAPPEPARVFLPVAGLNPRAKSLRGLPWRYALACIDDLGLILRAEVIWSKPNGLPESVTDRVRRSHEQWFHFTKEPRYFSAVDEIREAHLRSWGGSPNGGGTYAAMKAPGEKDANLPSALPNPLGKLPGSVWSIPTQPLQVPASLGVDHFAAFPMEWPRRIIRGWSPSGICVECGEGRRPVAERHDEHVDRALAAVRAQERVDATGGAVTGGTQRSTLGNTVSRSITGEACACPTPAAATRPAVVLDPFGGTGTTSLVASALGRTGISCDLSHDYSRLARWRTTDPGQRASAMQVEKPKPELPGQADLFGDVA